MKWPKDLQKMTGLHQVEVLTPLQRAMQPWLNGPRMAICDYNIFKVGNRVTTAGQGPNFFGFRAEVQTTWIVTSEICVFQPIGWIWFGRFLTTLAHGTAPFEVQLTLKTGWLNGFDQGGTNATIVGVDQDGDLPVFLKSGLTGATR